MFSFPLANSFYVSRRSNLLLALTSLLLTSSCAPVLFAPNNTASSLISQIDQNDSQEGFGGGTGVGVSWNSTESALVLSGSTDSSRNLPNNGSTTGWLNMTGNVFLAHLDEAAGATSFVDSSPSNLTLTCSTCPTTGVASKIGSGAEFSASKSGHHCRK